MSPLTGTPSGTQKIDIQPGLDDSHPISVKPKPAAENNEALVFTASLSPEEWEKLLTEKASLSAENQSALDKFAKYHGAE